MTRAYRRFYGSAERKRGIKAGLAAFFVIAFLGLIVIPVSASVPPATQYEAHGLSRTPVGVTPGHTKACGNATSPRMEHSHKGIAFASADCRQAVSDRRITTLSLALLAGVGSGVAVQRRDVQSKQGA